MVKEKKVVSEPVQVEESETVETQVTNTTPVLTLALQGESVTQFKEYINCINTLVSEVTININQDGLMIKAMDPANVSMVIWKYNKENCAEYKTNSEFSIGVNLNNLKDIFKRISKGTVKIVTGDQIVIKNTDKNTKTFTVPIIDTGISEQKVPELNYETIINMDLKDFKDMIEDSAVLSESVTFNVVNKKFNTNADGENMMGLLTDFNEIVAEGPNAKAKYSVEYLKKLIAKKSEKVKIEIKDDYPMRVSYKEPNSELIYILAPRVENSD